MKNVTIRGDGVAAYCCAHLLNKAGLGANLQRVERPRLPVIMLGDQALALIRDIFDQKELFAALPRIQKRVVAWGPKAEPLEIEHSAVVVSEESLLKGLRPNEEHAPDRGDSADTWTIFSSKPLPAPTQEHSFGSRIASAVAVTLTDAAVRSNACYIESLDAGWLFLIPRPPASNWLLAVGDSADALLARSRVIAPLITRFDPARSREWWA